jgi:hypothetical protein
VATEEDWAEQSANDGMILDYLFGKWLSMAPLVVDIHVGGLTVTN